MSGKFAISACLKPLILGLCIALLALPSVAHAQSPVRKVAIVASGTDEIYLEAARNFAEIITADEASTDVELSFIEAGKGAPNLDLSERIAGSDLVVTVGLNATQFISGVNPRPPVLAILIPAQAVKALLPSIASPVASRQWISAIVLDQPVERQLRLIKVLFNGTKSVGILLSSSNELNPSEIGKLSKRFGLDLYTEMVNQGENIFRELGYVLDKADVFLANPDPFIFNRQTAGNILQSAYRHRVPVIGFAQSHVKAGALSAVFSSPKQIGRQAGEFVLEYFKNDKMKIPAIQSPKYFSVGINRQVERSLGLALPKESVVEREIYSLESAAP